MMQEVETASQLDARMLMLKSSPVPLEVDQLEPAVFPLSPLVSSPVADAYKPEVYS